MEERQAPPAPAPEAEQASPQDAAAALLADVDYPKEFICPITQEVMTDPVVASDGFSYER